MCFSIPYVVINPILYAAIMALRLVAFSSFLIILVVSGIVNVMSLFMPAAACLLILGSLGAIAIAQWAQWIPDYKMWNHIFDTKITSSWSILASGWLSVSLHYYNGLIAVMDWKVHIEELELSDA